MNIPPSQFESFQSRLDGYIPEDLNSLKAGMHMYQQLSAIMETFVLVVKRFENLEKRVEILEAFIKSQK